ncbi:competence protein CoiA [Virgibacillus salexigens]|uniref:Competence protein n=1 Tax=Virgibacillus massiliensis TaxID=1462526 RepID=A0A024QDL8_9BACI|nr:competence protein CoiA family protein [Virgibacillus massiliensis]CDQ40638.1 Competence protein [Virgibacillus massiliensis]
MLQAITHQGDQIIIAAKSHAAIQKLKASNQKYYCPVCHSEVRIRAGTEVIPHFAHHANAKCFSIEGGEGEYHEQGKLMIYQWLEKQQLDVKLEPYLSLIKQRPDMLVEIGNKQIAIEFQCATIPKEVINNRSKGYQSSGIQPIWIIGANQLKRITATTLRISPFLLSMMHQFPSSTSNKLFFFCPDTKQFVIAQHVFIINKRSAIAKFRVRQLMKTTIVDLFREKLLADQELLSLWMREKEKFRTKPIHVSRLGHLWQQWLYRNQTSIIYLPSIIHLPVESQYFMKTPLWIWQSKLVMEYLVKISVGSYLERSRINDLFQSEDHYSKKDFPLIYQVKDPINQYLQLLCKLGIIKQYNLSLYKKQKNIIFHANLEQAINADRILLKQLMNAK